MVVKGLLPARLERITRERNPLMQAHAARRAAQDGYNDVGVVYVAPFTSGKVQSAHLPISDDDARLADFYCVAEGFDYGFNARNSRGHITSLASALAFMESAYNNLQVSNDPRQMMDALVRKTLRGTHDKLSGKGVDNANLDLCLVAVLPGENPGTARVVAGNFGGTNVMKYDAATNSYSFLFDGRSDGSRLVDTTGRGLPIWRGGSRYTHPTPTWEVVENEVKVGDELYLLTFVGDAWMNPGSANERIIDDAIKLKGARHIDLRATLDRGRIGPSIRDTTELLATRVNGLDKKYYEGSKVWWDCAIVGVRCVGEDSVGDPKAMYCNELVRLAGETEDLMRLLGNGDQGSAVKLLPAPLRDLVKPDK